MEIQELEGSFSLKVDHPHASPVMIALRLKKKIAQVTTRCYVYDLRIRHIYNRKYSAVLFCPEKKLSFETCKRQLLDDRNSLNDKLLLFLHAVFFIREILSRKVIHPSCNCTFLFP